MFKKILLLGSMLLIVAVNAQAAPFGITGTVTPGTCSVALTGGSVNLGTLSATTVKAYAVLNGTTGNSYVVPPVNVPISITCGAPTKVEASFVDNNIGKITPMDGNDSLRFGMVDGAGTTAMGAFQLQFITTKIDSVAVGQFLSAVNGSTTWVSTVPNTISVTSDYIAPGRTTGFAVTAGATTPSSFTTLTGTLVVSAFFNVNYINSATTALTPNGSGTLTLVYL